MKISDLKSISYDIDIIELIGTDDLNTIEEYGGFMSIPSKYNDCDVIYMSISGDKLTLQIDDEAVRTAEKRLTRFMKLATLFDIADKFNCIVKFITIDGEIRFIWEPDEEGQPRTSYEDILYIATHDIENMTIESITIDNNTLYITIK